MHKTRHLTFLASTSTMFLPCLEHTVQVSLRVLYSNKINSTFSVNSHSIVLPTYSLNCTLNFCRNPFTLVCTRIQNMLVVNQEWYHSQHIFLLSTWLTLSWDISNCLHLFTLFSFVSDYRLGHFTVISLPS